tara:strand:- start:1037 stop:1315 length:279 start_codon:yes stop_codon:yes gene_type:complete
MDIKALIKNLEALDDSLKSSQIRESDDFEECLERFQAKLADLIGVFESGSGESKIDPKTVVLELKDILEEIDTQTSHDSQVLDFVKDIVPTK